MIKEDYVSFEVAKLLKEKGFDECPLYCYDDCGQFWVQGGYDKTKKWHFPAPTLQMAMKWLREKHNIIICVEPHSYNTFDNKTSSYIFTYWTDDNYNEPYCWRNETNSVFGKSWSTYEEACEAAIKYCLETLI